MVFNSKNIINCLSELSQNSDFNNPEFSVLIQTFGSKPKCFYNETLKNNPSVEVLWSGWCCKNIFSYILYPFVAGFGGLCRVLDIKQTAAIYNEIEELCYSAIYYVPNEYVTKIQKYASDRKSPGDHILLIKSEKRAFVLLSDSDFPHIKEDENARAGELIIGNQVPESIKQILKKNRLFNEKLTIDELEKIQESKNLPEHSRKVITLLLASVNDWPEAQNDENENIDQHELDVFNFIGGNVTKETVKSALNKLDISKNAWEAESLESLIEVFDFYKKDMSLKDIIAELRSDLEKIGQ